MLIAFASDIHLDKRLGHAIDEGGVNRRTRDMERAFSQTVDAMIAAAPAIAVLAGDIFDSARPPERSRQFFVHEMVRLRAGLPADTTIIVDEGNHEVSMVFSDRTCLSTLALALPGVRIVANYTPQTIRVGDVSLTVIPWMRSDAEFLAAVAAAAPDPTAKVNGLVLHCGFADLPEYLNSGQTLTRALMPTDFDFIASGHFHAHTVYADLRFFYIGSTERTSIDDTTIKGYVTVDTDAVADTGVVAVETGRKRRKAVAVAVADRIPGLEFHPIATRPWYDLGPIDATGRDGAWIVDQVREAADAIPDWAEALVRLRVRHITRDVYDTLDRSGVRSILGRAFAYDDQISVDDPMTGAVEGDGEEPKFGSLSDDFAAFALKALAERDPEQVQRILSIGLQGLGAEMAVPADEAA